MGKIQKAYRGKFERLVKGMAGKDMVGKILGGGRRAPPAPYPLVDFALAPVLGGCYNVGVPSMTEGASGNPD